MNAELSAPELTTVLSRLHGMLLESAAATAAVAQLAEVARDLIPMATGAGVTLVDEHGQPRSTAATDPAVEAHARLLAEAHRRGIPAVFVAARVVGQADDPRL